ncbi:hypothetical protein [Thalassomonas sp. M1454]|uniref:hypothetical protein n=1 Tax=Thalassomonas sp. M1454 TaxID=2594477 RepID=UPI00163D99DB|nr:hypothetical protein [Thalassomonas sp. M1454]
MNSKANSKISISAQLKNNAIALISIVIAISSLSYNTWRNELTEHNRNVRTSSFEILMSLAQLQLLVDYAYYEENEDKKDPIKGWSYVLYIQDLTQTASLQTQKSANNLHSVWNDNWQQMDQNKVNSDNILTAIASLRSDVLTTLQTLD